MSYTEAPTNSHIGTRLQQYATKSRIETYLENVANHPGRRRELLIQLFQEFELNWWRMAGPVLPGPKKAMHNYNRITTSLFPKS